MNIFPAFAIAEVIGKWSMDFALDCYGYWNSWTFANAEVIGYWSLDFVL